MDVAVKKKPLHPLGIVTELWYNDPLCVRWARRPKQGNGGRVRAASELGCVRVWVYAKEEGCHRS